MRWEDSIKNVVFFVKIYFCDTFNHDGLELYKLWNHLIIWYFQFHELNYLLNSSFLKAIIASYDILCSNFSIDHSYPFFRSKNLINQEDQEDIRSKSTTSKRTSCFLDILLTKDIKLAFDSLIKFIKDRGGQDFLVDYLNEKLAENCV